MNATDRLLDAAAVFESLLRKLGSGLTALLVLFLAAPAPADASPMPFDQSALFRQHLTDCQLCEVAPAPPLDLDQFPCRHQFLYPPAVIPLSTTGCSPNHERIIVKISTKKRLPLDLCQPKLGRWRRKDPAPVPLPGFAAVQVTQQDVDRWLLAVPRMDPRSPRAAAYVRGQNVHGKIARAKAEGQFERIIDGRQFNGGVNRRA